MTKIEDRTEFEGKRRTVRARVAWGCGALVLLASIAMLITNGTVPQGNAGDGPVDVLLVLGTPAAPDGRPTRAETWRVFAAVEEYKAGRAPHVLFSGGAAANRFVEADTMAGLANRLGVPVAAIFEERDSLTTLQNIENCQKIMEAHHWQRLEAISSPDHLRRVAVLLSGTPLLWRVHAAPTPGRHRLNLVGSYVREAIGTTLFRWFGRRAEPLLHMAARAARWIGRIFDGHA